MNKLFFVRNGGVGDILMATPTLRALKRLNPLSSLEVYTNQYNFPLLQLNKNVDKLHDFNSYKPDRAYDNKTVYNLEGKLEDFNDPANKLNRIDAIAEKCDLKLNDHFTELDVNPKTEAWAKSYLDFNVSNNVSLIGLSLFGEFRVRSWTYRNVYELANYFDKTRYRLILFGDKCKYGFELPGVLNTCGLLSLDKFIALLKQCALILTTDSAALHISGALDIPTIALFGSLPPEVRTSYYDRCNVIVNDKLDCVPCWEWQDVDPHNHSHCMNKEVRCMSEIPPLMVYNRTMQYLRELEV